MSQSTFLSPDAAHHQAQQQHMLQQGHAHQIHPAHMQQQQQQGQMSSQGYDAFTGHSNGADNFFASDSLWGMGAGAGSGSADEMAAAMNAAVASGSAPPPTAVSSGSPAMNGGRSNSSNGSGSNSNIPAKRRTGSSMGRSPSNQEGGGNSPLHHLQASGQASHTSSPHHTQTTFFGGGSMAASPTSQHFTHDVNPATTTPGPRGGPSGAAAAARFAMPDRSDSMQPLGGFDLKMTDPAEQLMLQQQQLQQQQQGTPGSSGGPGTAAGASASGDASGEGGESAAEKSKSSRFVFKLMRMVSDPESQHLISFNPSGTSVVVTNFDDFAKEVLPKHFKHSNFSSFIRQLNMYGFYKVNKTPRGQRTTNDSQVWEFSHPKFIRGRTDLLEEIRRKALDNDHARVEARDLRFNVSLGQLQVRHHLEEMQWRLDQTMEQNFQLREFGLGMREALSTVLEYLKAANGGQCPVDVRLPHLDPIGMMHSPMPPPSPYGFGPHGGGPPGAWNMLPTQPSPQMQQGGPMQGMPPHHLHHQHQQQPQPPQHDRPSIFVTEPVAMGGGGGGGPPGSVASVPPSPQDMNGPFSSMGNLGNVSPFGAGSRRVSGSSERPPNDLPDYFALAQGASASGGGGSMPNVFDDGGASEAGSATIRPGFANLPRRSLSNRGLNIQTNIPGGGEGSMPGTAGGPGGSSSHPQQAMNPGLGVLGAPNFTDGSPFGPGPGLTPQQLQQQQQHFQAAINTPLPPSPAIPGYHPHAAQQQQQHLQQHQQHPHSYPLNGNGGMTPASAAAAAAAAAHFQGQGPSFPPTGGVSPSMLSAHSFDGNHHGLGVAGGSGGSAMGTPALSSSPSSSLPSALLDDEDDEPHGHGVSGLVSTSQSDDDDDDDDDDSDASAADTSLDLLSAPTTADTTVSTGSISRRNKKAMRTPLKRTASGHSEAMVMMAAGEGMGMGGLEETPTNRRGGGGAGMNTPSGGGGAGKRKSPH